MIKYMIWNIQPAEIWMIVGFLFVFIELMQLPGFGFFFLGLGGLSVSIVLASDRFAISTFHQFIIFSIASLVWIVLLWKPLKKLNLHSFNNTYNDKFHDMIGQSVIVLHDEIMPGLLGKVKWSGTIMNASLIEGETKTAHIGQKLFIKEIMGNVLICEFKDI